MTAPTFKALDSGSGIWRAGQIIPAGMIRRLDENAEYVRENMPPVLVRPFMLREGGNDVRRMTWHTARWSPWGPVWAYVPPTLFLPDATIDVLIRYEADADELGLQIAAYSLEHANRTGRQISRQRAIDDVEAGEDWTGSATTTGSRATLSLENIPVAPGWNQIWLVMKSAADRTGLGYDDDTGDQQRSARFFYFDSIDSGSIPSGSDEVPKWWTVANSTTTVGDDEELFTVGNSTAENLKTNGTFALAEYIVDFPPDDGLGNDPPVIHWGKLGYAEIYSIACDLSSQGRDYTPLARARWRQPAGRVVFDTARKVRSLHAHRLPQPGFLWEQFDVTESFPGWWRVFEVSKSTALNASVISRHWFRDGQVYGDFQHFLEVKILYCAVAENAEATSDGIARFNVSIDALDSPEPGPPAPIVTSAFGQLFAEPPDVLSDTGYTTHWIKSYATYDRAWSHDGFTDFTDLNTLWREATVRFRVDNLFDTFSDNDYEVTVSTVCNGSADTTQPSGDAPIYLCIGAVATRLEAVI